MLYHAAAGKVGEVVKVVDSDSPSKACKNLTKSSISSFVIFLVVRIESLVPGKLPALPAKL